jgi:hypothetical protein
MVDSATTAPRECRRYLVVGSVVLRIGRQKIEGELVNVGPGGMLVFCDAVPSLGERVDVRFTVQDYPLEIRVQGRIVHSAAGLVGIGFLDEPEALGEILLWLEAGFLACLL